MNEAQSSPASAALPRHFFRIRSLDRLLAKGELAKQQIFFAESSTLNDPMEGFQDIFWNGDEIEWTALLRHYVQCLAHARCFAMLDPKGESLGFGNIPFIDPDHERLPPAVRSIHAAAVKAFLAADGVAGFISQLASRSVPVRRDELSVYLQGLHPFALSAVQRVFAAEGLAPKGVDLEPPDAIANGLRALLRLPKLMESAGKGRPDPDDLVARFAAISARQFQQMGLLSHMNFATGLAAYDFALLSFPSAYLDRLGTLVRAPWYCACFSEDVTDSSLWGTYGDGHTGVALKFRATEIDGRMALPLARQVRWGAGPTRHESTHAFEPVAYGRKPTAIDFFASLGALNAPTLRKWHVDEAGQRSAGSLRMFEDEQRWRDDYWKAMMASATMKLDDWSHEREHRLVIFPVASDMSEPESRLAEYRFEDLEGIVFGIRTPADEKMEIIKIVEKKCISSRREDFSFYQAYYAPGEGAVRYERMSLLRIKIHS